MSATILVTIVEDDYSLCRVWLPGYAIYDLLYVYEARGVLQIDLIPEIEDETIRLGEISAGTIPPISELDEDSPRLVIIDSGIATGHPLFTDGTGHTIIGRQRNFLPETFEANDYTADDIDEGHGTAVASIAAYGSLSEFLLNQALDRFPSFWIENAKVMFPSSKINNVGSNRQPSFHPHQIPKQLMRTIVEYFHQSQPDKCKIFNLSAGSAPHRLKSPMSNWAEEIDNLSARNDILFIVAAGNININEIAAISKISGGYPRYLLDPRSRLRNPAQAYNAIAVGAIANSDILPAHLRGREISISPIRHPSPFTRTGTMIDDVVKPDIVECGGNLTESLRPINTLSVPVANRNFIAGAPGHLITFHVGTSLATPKIAHLAARIQTTNIGASANLIRALIINSAEWPDLFPLNINILGATENERISNILRLCGYGIPRESCAISSNTHFMIYTVEDEFIWQEEDTTKSGNNYCAKVSFYRIEFDTDAIMSLPPGLRIRISITLAYNPPVRKTRRKHYQGIEMRWDLQRQNELFTEFRERWYENLIEIENQIEGQVEEEQIESRPWPWTLKPVINPGNKNRHGSILRDWFEISANQLPSPIEVAVIAKVSPWITPPGNLSQKFALVVSIESCNQMVPIYDEIRIRQRVQVIST
jgi:hypothetical protein